jgi:hypothetical protein
MPIRVQKVRVDLFVPELKTIVSDLAAKDVTRVTLKVLNRARVQTPVDTGNLRAGHGFKLTKGPGRVKGEVFNKIKYALPVHEGRRAVTIHPDKKKALAFRWHGQQFVRKSVTQPARRGRPWLRDSLTEVAAAEGYRMQSTAAG